MTAPHSSATSSVTLLRRLNTARALGDSPLVERLQAELDARDEEWFASNPPAARSVQEPAVHPPSWMMEPRSAEPEASGRPPSPRQVAVLEFVRNFTTHNGPPPTLREIAAHIGVRSTNAVAFHLDRLESKGMLVRDAHGKSRAIRLTEHGLGFLDRGSGRPRVIPLDEIALERRCTVCYRTTFLPTCHGVAATLRGPS